MRVAPDVARGIVERLRPAEAEVHAIMESLRRGGDYVDCVTRLAVVSRVLDRAGFALVADGLQQCAAGTVTGADRDALIERMERLFLSLA